MEVTDDYGYVEQAGFFFPLSQINSQIFNDFSTQQEKEKFNSFAAADPPSTPTTSQSSSLDAKPSPSLSECAPTEPALNGDAIGLLLFFDGLTQVRGSSYLGLFSNAWVCLADAFGPSHPDALEADKIIRKLLDAPKTGYQLDKSAFKLLEKAWRYKPCHMFATVEDARNCNTNSKSILTEIHKRVFDRISGHDESKSGVPVIVDEEQMTIFDEFFNRFNFLDEIINFKVGKSGESQETNAASSFNDFFGPLFERWCQYVNEYRDAQMKINHLYKDHLIGAQEKTSRVGPYPNLLSISTPSSL